MKRGQVDTLTDAPPNVAMRTKWGLTKNLSTKALPSMRAGVEAATTAGLTLSEWSRETIALHLQGATAGRQGETMEPVWQTK